MESGVSSPDLRARGGEVVVSGMALKSPSVTVELKSRGSPILVLQ